MKIIWVAGSVTAATVLAATLFLSPANGLPPLLQDHRNSWASFDCRKAETKVEKLICGDTDLQLEDGRLGYQFAKVLRLAPASARPRLMAEQRAWLRRRDSCANTRCISDQYSARDMVLWSERERWGRAKRRAVSRIGQCQVTNIQWIGPRLGNEAPTSHDRPDDSGTSVSFANGVDQVSYDLERPVARSRIGDRARVCLVEIPQHCPPGDHRGRVYRVTNLRTGEHWTMADSQHECGGA